MFLFETWFDKHMNAAFRFVSFHCIKSVFVSFRFIVANWSFRFVSRWFITESFRFVSLSLAKMSFKSRPRTCGKVAQNKMKTRQKVVKKSSKGYPIVAKVVQKSLKRYPKVLQRYPKVVQQLATSCKMLPTSFPNDFRKQFKTHSNVAQKFLSKLVQKF